jgi:DNA-binding CsgD family transcriptional regulator
MPETAASSRHSNSRPVATDAYLLSRREHDIVGLLLRGDRVPSIAEQLWLTRGTVRNHLNSVYRKLGVQSQQELIVLLRGLRQDHQKPAEGVMGRAEIRAAGWPKPSLDAGEGWTAAQETDAELERGAHPLVRRPRGVVAGGHRHAAAAKARRGTAGGADRRQ